MLHREKKSVNFLLSTLESYHQNPSGDQTQLISYTPESDVVKLKIIDKSSELRTAAFWKEGESWVFAGGLEPSLYTYKFKDQSVNKIKIELSKIFNLKNHKIIGYKHSRVIYSPKKDWLKKAEKILKRFVTENDIQVDNRSFEPINTSKVWNLLKHNIRKYKI